MTGAAQAYAQGLYSLAAQENLSKTILDELLVLEQAFSQEPKYLRLLTMPNIPKQERCEILDRDFRGNIQPYLLNFMKILVEKGYISQFSKCCKAYHAQYNLDNGILPVKVTTAVALQPEQAQRLRAKLEKLTGKTVELTNICDKQCLGGIRLDYDGKRMDATVQNRLAQVSDLLKNTVL